MELLGLVGAPGQVLFALQQQNRNRAALEQAAKVNPLPILADIGWENRVVFPAPVPVFARQYRADVQRRLVELYFVRGWSFYQLGGRYRITAGRVRQTIRRWVEHAIALNYLQSIATEGPCLPAKRTTGEPVARASRAGSVSN